MKNTVYSLSRDSKANSAEQFAMELADYLLHNNPQVTAVSVDIAEKKWEHVTVAGKPHPTTYSLNGDELQTVSITKPRGGSFDTISGIAGLVILKTTHSEFTGYIKDKLTTLPETTDRIFATRATIIWGYSHQPGDFSIIHAAVRERVLTTFAEHHSLSVQHTMHDIGAAVLAAVADISWIKMTMPNLHCLPVNLAPFGQDNPNMIFVPTDEPSGYREATLRR
jgi:urate oxidase